MKPGISLLAFLIFWIALASQTVAQDQTHPPVDGYILQTRHNALQLQALHLDQYTNTITAFAPQFEDLQGERQYSTLSPDGSRLASVTLDSNGNSFLALFELSTRVAIWQLLPDLPNTDPQSRYAVRWSPDSSRLYLSPSLTLGYIFDVETQQLTPVPAKYVSGFQWLPDSARFMFNSSPQCGESCRAYSDVYLGTYSNQEVTVQPVTRLDVKQMDLAGYVPRIIIALGSLTYNPTDERLYGSIGDDPTNPGGYELLYSTDLQGNLRFEADIGGIKSDAGYAPQIWRIVFSQADDNLYLLVYNDGTVSSGGLPQYSIMRFVPGSGVTTVFEYTSPGFGEGVRLPLAIELSNDGRYLAVGTANPTRLEAGNLMVFDLIQEVVVVQIENLLPVCQVNWTRDSSHILYTQTNDQRCIWYSENQPISRLVAINLATLQSRVIQQANLSPFYFVSPGQ